MSALNRRGVLTRLHREERGAVGTIFAILLAGGVLLGMLALVIDVGMLYAEREELQGGADSAAIAIAGRCALPDAADCGDSDVVALAQGYANANARDKLSAVLEVCGTLVGDWSECSPPLDNLTDCIPATPTDGRPYVEVRTGTQTTNDTVLPPVFAQTMAGNDSYEGTTVRACARAVVGPPGGGLGVTFAECEFDWAVDDVAALPSGPAFTSTHREVVLKLHDSQGQPPLGCTGMQSSGGDLPGGFGWIDGINSQCEVTFVNGTYIADTGNNVPAACHQRLEDAANNPATVVYLPIYQSVAKHGKQYTASRIAAFVPTGYFFGNGKGNNNDSWLPGTQASCNGQERCIFGYFVNVTGPGTLGPADLESLGATVIALSG